LAQNKQREAIFASMTEGVVTVGMEGRLIQINEAATAMLGLPKGVREGRLIEEVLRWPELQKFIRRTLQDRKFCEQSFEIHREEKNFFQVKGNPLLSPQGITTG